jgi:hypothetical protein
MPFNLIARRADPAGKDDETADYYDVERLEVAAHARVGSKDLASPDAGMRPTCGAASPPR